MPVFPFGTIIVDFPIFYATAAAGVSDIYFESPCRVLAGFIQLARLV
jgi:hypothetical protein